MNFKIICDNCNRLRLRFGKYIISKEQGYKISSLILSVNDVKKVRVNHVNGSVLVEYEKPECKKEVFKILSSLSVYELEDGIATEEEKRDEIDTSFRQKLVKIVFKHGFHKLVLPLFLPSPWRVAHTAYRSIPFLRSGFRQLRRGQLNVEVLDATSITASLCTGQHKTSSSIMFLLSLSELLLEYSNARAKNALAGSLSINIDKVWLVKDDVEISIPTKDLAVGDVIRVRMGSMIPVDGTIVTGEALINEAMMTGEPLSVHKDVGSTVFAGTVIEEGDISLEVLELSNSS
ncbi:MAG: heavy metal translocating P-type ATPase, partial [Clostridia bacterium]